MSSSYLSSSNVHFSMLVRVGQFDISCPVGGSVQIPVICFRNSFYDWMPFLMLITLQSMLGALLYSISMCALYVSDSNTCKTEISYPGGMAIKDMHGWA